MVEDADEARGQDVSRRRAVAASLIGSCIEWYDFILYSTAAGLVFPRLFFPHQDPLVATFNAYGIFAAGFLARPIGAVLFGHFGDRFGRKATLVGTLTFMGVGTFFVALTPTYHAIGAWGALILVFLRFVQGMGVGGEWAGAVLVAMEWSKPGKKGFTASLPQIGVPVGLITANLAFVISSFATGDAFFDWGWRVPFVVSGLLVAVGLYMRLSVEETPVFRQLVAEKKVARQPVLQAIRQNYRAILTIAFLRMSEMAMFQIMTVFVFTMGVQVLKLERNFILTAVLTAAVVSCICTPLFGALSDRIGRRRLFGAGAVIAGLFGFFYFFVLGLGVPALVFAVIAVSLIPHAMMFGPEAALVTGVFSSEVRYSASSIGYQLAALVAGGPTPMITAALFLKDQSGYAVAAYLAFSSVVSLVALSLLRPERETEPA